MTHPPTRTSPTTSPLHTALARSPAIERGARIARPAVTTNAFPASVIVAACIAVHVLAATVIYHDLIADLYALFDATPRLLALEQGLRRLTATSIFLPPLIPTALILAAVAWLGRSRRDGGVRRWLALATVPLAADSVLRAVGVSIAPAPGNIGDLLDLPSRFSPGPRLILDLAGVHPGAAAAYWVVVCTLAAALSAWCVAQAILVAERGRRESARRRRREAVSMDALQAAITAAGIWIALAAAGQVALPFATQLFLQTFG